MTDAQGSASRPPLGLAMRSLLRADAVVLVRNRVSATLSVLLPIVIVVATSVSARTGRLGAPL